MNWFSNKNIIVPLDFSEVSLRSLEIAAEHVDDLSKLHVIHVLPNVSPLERGFDWSDTDSEKRRKKGLEAVKQRLKKMNPDYENLDIEVRVGVAGKEIVHYSKKKKADLIIIASHGHTRAHDFLLGGTVNKVAHWAECSVLVLKH